MEGDVLFELVDLSQLWVFADIFEEEVPLVELGLSVEVMVQHLPDQVFHGEIAFIDHMVKPGTRTVPIRVDIANGLERRVESGEPEGNEENAPALSSQHSARSKPVCLPAFGCGTIGHPSWPCRKMP